MPYILQELRFVEQAESGSSLFFELASLLSDREDLDSARPQIIRDFIELLVNRSYPAAAFPHEGAILDPSVSRIVDALARNIDRICPPGCPSISGVLNYCLTRMMHELYPVSSYAVFNEIMGIFASLIRRAEPSHFEALGMLSACQAEYYRKRVAPYEDRKEAENGEVPLSFPVSS